ncbi:hypothetical protein NHF46_12005 [Arthrobacter alpinus]|nr:hypothetical protein [Arthrobacter alpinus]
MGLKDWPSAGFPGTAVNPMTLIPEVVDEESCTQALAESMTLRMRYLCCWLEG